MKKKLNVSLYCMKYAYVWVRIKLMMKYLGFFFFFNTRSTTVVIKIKNRESGKKNEEIAKRSIYSDRFLFSSSCCNLTLPTRLATRRNRSNRQLELHREIYFKHFKFFCMCGNAFQTTIHRWLLFHSILFYNESFVVYIYIYIYVNSYIIIAFSFKTSAHSPVLPDCLPASPGLVWKIVENFERIFF